MNHANIFHRLRNSVRALSIKLLIKWEGNWYRLFHDNSFNGDRMNFQTTRKGNNQFPLPEQRALSYVNTAPRRYANKSETYRSLQQIRRPPIDSKQPFPSIVLFLRRIRLNASLLNRCSPLFYPLEFRSFFSRLNPCSNDNWTDNVVKKLIRFFPRQEGDGISR